MGNVDNLYQLSNILDNNTHLSLLDKMDLVNSYKGYDWIYYMTESKGKSYARVEIQCNSCDMFVVTWKPNVSSGIHNHASEGCIMKYLSNYGYLIEDRYSTKNPHIYLDSSVLLPNSVSYISDLLYLHSITNETSKYITTLHIYHPKGFKTRFFN
jgi:hypothetical protein